MAGLEACCGDAVTENWTRTASVRVFATAAAAGNACKCSSDRRQQCRPWWHRGEIAGWFVSVMVKNVIVNV